jgi:hypothetical protein
MLLGRQGEGGKMKYMYFKNMQIEGKASICIKGEVFSPNGEKKTPLFTKGRYKIVPVEIGDYLRCNGYSKIIEIDNKLIKVERVINPFIKERRLFIGGYYEDWGAKHHETEYFGPILSREERIKIGATIEYYSAEEDSDGCRYEIVIYSIRSNRNEIDLGEFGVQKFKIGWGGWDNALADPWDRIKYDEEIKETTIVRLFDDPKTIEEIYRLKIT